MMKREPRSLFRICCTTSSSSCPSMFWRICSPGKTWRRSSPGCSLLPRGCPWIRWRRTSGRTPTSWAIPSPALCLTVSPTVSNTRSRRIPVSRRLWRSSRTRSGCAAFTWTWGAAILTALPPRAARAKSFSQFSWRSPVMKPGSSASWRIWSSAPSRRWRNCSTMGPCLARGSWADCAPLPAPLSKEPSVPSSSSFPVILLKRAIPSSGSVTSVSKAKPAWRACSSAKY